MGFLAPPRLWPQQQAPRRHVKKQYRRGALTHVALITDLPPVQAKLPQIFLCNQRIVPARALTNPVLQKGPTVEFWLEKSGWNNSSKMVRILRKVRDAMSEFGALQPIVLLDACPCHIHPRVAAAAEELGLWLVVVPAKLTFLVQPLDVYAFSPYKACLAKLFAEHEDATGNLEVLSWMQCLCTAVRKFWCARKWRTAFEQTGVLRAADSSLTVELQHLNIGRLLASPVPLPTQEAVALTFPRGRTVPYVSLFWHPGRIDPPLLT